MDGIKYIRNRYVVVQQLRVRLAKPLSLAFRSNPLVLSTSCCLFLEICLLGLSNILSLLYTVDSLHILFKPFWVVQSDDTLMCTGVFRTEFLAFPSVWTTVYDVILQFQPSVITFIHITERFVNTE